MYNSQLFLESKSALETSNGVKQALALLPEGVEISIVLDKRIPCALVYKNGSELSLELCLEPRKALNPDFEFIVYPELIRLFKENSPEDLIALSKDIAAMHLSGRLRFSLLSSVNDLYKKGYLTSLKKQLKKLPFELQSVCMKYFFRFATQASLSAEALRKLFRK